MTRRTFAASVGAAGYSRPQGANERVNVGLIGVGARGDRLHDVFRAAGAGIAAACDLSADYLTLATRKSDGVFCTDDYRRILDRKDIDAVVIATPDHWHAIQTIDACRAGKHVYVEKPMSLTVREGRRMVAAAQQSQRIVQVGLQRRSSALVREAVEFVRSGGIGQVTGARAFDLLNEWPNGIGKARATEPPAGFNWHRWIGPAPDRPFNANRTFYNYRWFWDYSGGQLTNNGIHYLDVIRWAIGADAPLKVAAIGGHYGVRDEREVPDTLEVIWEFPGPVLVSFTQYNANGAPASAQGGAEVEIRGTNGTLYLHGNRYEVIPEATSSTLRYRPSPLRRSDNKANWTAARKPAMEMRSSLGNVLADREHAANFLAAVRGQQACAADALTGHLSTASCLIGNIALRTNSMLLWDAEHERCKGNPQADAYLDYKYREPYKAKT